MNYDAWRISFQTAEQAARSAFADAQHWYNLLQDEQEQTAKLRAELRKLKAQTAAPYMGED